MAPADGLRQRAVGGAKEIARSLHAAPFSDRAAQREPGSEGIDGAGIVRLVDVCGVCIPIRSAASYLACPYVEARELVGIQRGTDGEERDAVRHLEELRLGE